MSLGINQLSSDLYLNNVHNPSIRVIRHKSKQHQVYSGLLMNYILCILPR